MIKANPKLGFFDKLIFVVNWIVACGILISYLAPYVNPQKFWPVALFGLGYSPLLLANVLCLLYWLIRLKKEVVISAICILLGYKVLPYSIGLNKPTDDVQKTSEQYIRMMEYNVHSFTNFKAFNDIPTKNQILDVIREQQPDVISIEEFYTRYRGQFDTRDSVKKILNTQYFYFQSFNTRAADQAGMAIYSKYPIINTGLIRLSRDSSDTNAIYADLQKGDKIFRVYCIHLQSFLFEPDDYKYINHVTDNPDKETGEWRRIMRKLKNGFVNRSKQIAILKQHAAQCPYPYIFSGDFNDTPSSFVVQQMGQGLKNAFHQKGFGIGKTYNGDFPNFQIDYILASPQFEVINYKMIQKKLSDHYPIRSDLWLK